MKTIAGKEVSPGKRKENMEEKNFYALFRRFQPTEEQRAILDQGKVLSRKIDEKNPEE